MFCAYLFSASFAGMVSLQVTAASFARGSCLYSGAGGWGRRAVGCFTVFPCSLVLGGLRPYCLVIRGKSGERLRTIGESGPRD